MKNLFLLAIATLTAASATAEVLPGQVGIYRGTYSAVTVDTASKARQKYKTKVLCSINADASTTITSDDGLLIEGTLAAGEHYGFFYEVSDFVTNTGIWKFKKNGNVKAQMQYGVTPGGNVTFIVSGKLRLDKQEDVRF